MPKEYCKDLQRLLKDESKELDVVVMPDFFLDRLLSLNWGLNTFSRNLESVAKKKGGSIDGIHQTELRGGNAINTASALAALGAKVTPIVCTDKLGLEIIRFCLRPRKVNLSHVKILGEASMTTAMEFITEGGKTNIMLRSVGALAHFGPKHLNDDDFQAIENADYVCVFNWAGTKYSGTQLAKTVFHDTKTKGRGKTYYDTADPTPNKRKIPELMKSVLQSKDVDILSLNENEAICYATQMKDAPKELKGLPIEKAAKESAKILASHLSARVDLHTTKFSATFDKKGVIVVPSFKVPVMRATGAGDAWNAGNIWADAHRITTEQRLALANAVAAYYVSNPNGTHPTRRELIKFCEKLERKKHIRRASK